MRLEAPYRLQWEEAQEAFVLLYPEGLVKLNATAGEILALCDGSRSVGTILAELKARFPDDDPERDVLEFLEAVRDKGWITND